MGAKIVGHFSKRVTHVFANNITAFMQHVGQSNVASFKGVSYNLPPFFV